MVVPEALQRWEALFKLAQSLFDLLATLAQVVRLIASTGHVGKTDDFTIKPMEQHSYLLSGFSWHASIPALVQWHGSIDYRGGRP